MTKMSVMIPLSTPLVVAIAVAVVGVADDDEDVVQQDCNRNHSKKRKVF